MSRHGNCYLKLFHIKLEDIRNCIPRITQSCWFTGFDLAQMYHQVKLHTDIHYLFGFALPKPSGGYEFYQYQRLPFGTSTAVYLVNLLLDPIKKFAHTLNLDLSVYIDDGLHIAVRNFRSRVGIRFIIFLFRFCGWQIQWTKCQLEPSHKITYLGYEINSENMSIRMPDAKIEKILIYIDELQLAYSSHQLIAARYFAQYCGKLAHCLPTHGLIIKFITKFSHHSLGSCVAQNGWDSSMPISADVSTEIQLVRKYIHLANGSPLFPAQATFPVIHHQEIEYIQTEINPNDRDKPFHVFVSDSSNYKAYSYRAGKLDLTTEYFFTPTEASLSSSFRELLAIMSSFTTHQNFFRKNAHSIILWISDSQVLVSWLQKGSRIPFVQRLLVQIKLAEHSFKIKLYPKWVPRSNKLLTLADSGSKMELSASEYGLDHAHYNMLENFFNVKFDVDGFSTRINKRTQRYISLLPDQEAFDCDFFYHELNSNLIYYLHPPINCIKWTLTKLCAAPDISAVVILPVWTSASYWPTLLNGEFFAWFVSEFAVIRPCYAYFNDRAMFKGYRSFPTLAIFVRTRNQHKIPLPNFDDC